MEMRMQDSLTSTTGASARLTATSPSLASLEAALAARFESLRRECFHGHYIGGTGRCADCGARYEVRDADGYFSKGVHWLEAGYVPAVTTDLLLEAMAGEGYTYEMHGIGVLLNDEFVEYETLPGHTVIFWPLNTDSEARLLHGTEANAPTPREACIRAAVAALGLA